VIVRPTELADACLVDLELRGDERGFFARAWCAREFEAAGLPTNLAQANMSGSGTRGTIRGLHFQVEPAAETKFVRCVRGAILDVIVDLRRGSPSYMEWQGFELSEHNRTALFVPEGFAHGFQSLTDDVELYYMTTEFYTPEHERGLRWNDPVLGIDWPLEATVISDKDAAWPLLADEPDFGFRFARRSLEGDTA